MFSISHPQYIHISSPACIFIYRVLSPGPLVETYPRRCFGFLALSSFQVLCAVQTPCAITPQSIQSNHASHATTLPHHVTLALFAILDLHRMAVCIRTSPRCSAFCVCRHLRGGWSLSPSDVFLFFWRCYASAISPIPFY